MIVAIATNMPKSNVNCCVVGCSNTYSNSPEVKFYSFPSKPREIELRRKWIAAVRRERPDGQQWEPKKRSFICSRHFVGNNKVNHPSSPSYLPTIFPKVYKKKKTNIEQDVARFTRTLTRTRSAASSSTSSSTLQTEEPVINEEEALEIQPQFYNHSGQVEFGLENEDFIFECTHISPRDVLVQCNLPRQTIFSKSIETVDCASTTMETYLLNDGFHGWKSIKKEQQLLDLCGVKFNTFSMLLTFLKSEVNYKISKEDRLLLFLMKIKLGLRYSSLRVIFDLHRTSVSVIFKSVLEQLFIRMQGFIFWPSKYAVRESLPNAFRAHYPNTRVIIDCSEIRTETPSGIEQRNYLYSNYKSDLTIKFLIGVNPNGMICFISKCYGGRASEAFITNDSGFLDLLEPGDVVLADKGFPGIEVKDGVVLVTPPRVHEGHLTSDEVDTTYKVATVRIHVERCINRINFFNILVNRIPTTLFPYIDKILFVACALTNLSPPIIKD